MQYRNYLKGVRSNKYSSNKDGVTNHTESTDKATFEQAPTIYATLHG